MNRLVRSFVTSYSRSIPSTTFATRRSFFDFGGNKNETVENKPADTEETTQKHESAHDLVIESPELVQAMETIKTQKEKINESAKQINELKATLNRQELGIRELKQKIKELQDRVVEEINEQDSIRERSKKEIETNKSFAISSMCKKLLDVCDTLDMAMDATKKSSETNDEVRKIAEGIDMTQKIFAKVLGDFGVKKYESIGKMVDPSFHDVTAQVPDPTKPPGTVSFVIKDGYLIHDRILRAAQVVAVRDDSN